jgi:hypothetical protein
MQSYGTQSYTAAQMLQRNKIEGLSLASLSSLVACLLVPSFVTKKILYNIDTYAHITKLFHWSLMLKRNKAECLSLANLSSQAFTHQRHSSLMIFSIRNKEKKFYQCC